MTDHIVRQYLLDAGVNPDLLNIKEFTEFARFYFKELVKIGAFLNDVPFTNLTPMAKYNVIGGAFRLWTKAAQTP